MITYDTAERPSAAEYVAFLSRTELGSMYPRKAFRARIESLLENVDICVTARTSDRTLVGVCLGLTDFAYFLYLTDLGVDRDHLRRGIGRRLVRLAHD
ncbi:MAG: GNAT family N-acetyltransferase, partial [Planctomycetota bacterium]